MAGVRGRRGSDNEFWHANGRDLEENHSRSHFSYTKKVRKVIWERKCHRREKLTKPLDKHTTQAAAPSAPSAAPSPAWLSHKFNHLDRCAACWRCWSGSELALCWTSSPIAHGGSTSSVCSQAPCPHTLHSRCPSRLLNRRFHTVVGPTNPHPGAHTPSTSSTSSCASQHLYTHPHTMQMQQFPSAVACRRMLNVAEEDVASARPPLADNLRTLLMHSMMTQTIFNGDISQREWHQLVFKEKVRAGAAPWLAGCWRFALKRRGVFGPLCLQPFAGTLRPTA